MHRATAQRGTAPPEHLHGCPCWGPRAQRGPAASPRGEMPSASPGLPRRPVQQGRRRVKWFGSWGEAGAPQQPSPHVAVQNQPGPKPSAAPAPCGDRGRAGFALPYHGNVVAGMEEDGEVGLLQAFLQSLQPLHHLIRVIPGEPCVQRQRSVRSPPQASHPKGTSKRCRALGVACSWPSFQGGAEDLRLLPRPRGACPAGTHCPQRGDRAQAPPAPHGRCFPSAAALAAPQGED